MKCEGKFPAAFALIFFDVDVFYNETLNSLLFDQIRRLVSNEEIPIYLLVLLSF